MDRLLREGAFAGETHIVTGAGRGSGAVTLSISSRSSWPGVTGGRGSSASMAAATGFIRGIGTCILGLRVPSTRMTMSTRSS